MRKYISIQLRISVLLLIGKYDTPPNLVVESPLNHSTGLKIPRIGCERYGTKQIQHAATYSADGGYTILPDISRNARLLVAPARLTPRPSFPM